MNWRLIVVALAFAGVCSVVAYWKGYSDADKTADIQTLTKQRDDLKKSLDDYKATNGRLTEITKNAKAKEDSAVAISDGLRGDADRMRGQLRSIIELYSPGSTAGRPPTDKIIAMLAGLLDEAAGTADGLAAEAERYRRAGEVCELSYDALKRQQEKR